MFLIAVLHSGGVRGEKMRKNVKVSRVFVWQRYLMSWIALLSRDGEHL
jgi:hypothetical protein